MALFKYIHFFICVYIDWLVQIYVLICTESTFCLCFYRVSVVCGFYWCFSSYYRVSCYFWRLSYTSSWCFISSLINRTSFSYFTNIYFFFCWVYCWYFCYTWSSYSCFYYRFFIYWFSIRLISSSWLLISNILLLISSSRLFISSIIILISSILNRFLISLFNSSNSKRFLFIISNRRISSLNISRRSISNICSSNRNLFNSLIQIPNSSIFIIIIIKLIFSLI